MAGMFLAFGLAVAVAMAFAGICWRQRRIIVRLRRRNSEIWIDWRTARVIERFQGRQIDLLKREQSKCSADMDAMVAELLEGDRREEALTDRCRALELEVENLRAQASRGAA